jgi:large subunit ribosomal protein L5
MNRLKERYEKEIKTDLMAKFEYKSIMQVPKIEKIVVNIGVGDAVNNAKLLDESVAELEMITGQKPVVTKAKKSIAGFKLISISLPRVRDFRGISADSFDGRGNYTLGIKEQLIFPEINFDKVNKTRGMDIVIVTSANTDEEARELLAQVGMPFAK